MDSRLRELAGQLMAEAKAAALDPSRIDAKLLPYLFVLEAERRPSGDLSALRVRLTGTSLDQMFGRPLQGRALEEFVHGPRGDRVLEGFHHCAEKREALWMRQVVEFKERAPRFVEGIAVPFASDRICGGLIAGELVIGIMPFETFERRPLMSSTTL